MPLKQLCPPEVFGIVEKGIFRTNAFFPINFSFIKLLNVQTIVQLSPEVPIKALTTFMEDNNIRHIHLGLIHLGLKAWKPDHESWKPVTEELIKEALEIVLDTTYHPIMVMCSSGIHQTGTLVGCLRRLQNWSLNSILVEYKSFACHRSTRFGDEQFIELFDVDLVTLPHHLPDWFIEQRKMLEEERTEMDKQGAREFSEDEEAIEIEQNPHSTFPLQTTQVIVETKKN